MAGNTQLGGVQLQHTEEKAAANSRWVLISKPDYTVLSSSCRRVVEAMQQHQVT